MTSRPRPPFIVSTADVPARTIRYPNSTEEHASTRPIGKAAGLVHFGLHVEHLPPGHRTSYPHCEEKEEEFVFVLEGQVDAWIDGVLFRMKKGDLAAFPAGTGISHSILGNGDHDALLFVGGDATIAGSRICYPLNPERRADCEARGDWWADAPQRTLGAHDGKARAGASSSGDATGRAPRPPFIIATADAEETSFSYPGSSEVHGDSRAIGKHAGLSHLGLHVHRLQPGQRTSYPHCEEGEEEFVFVLEGEVDAWIDGEIFPMKKHDLAAFPAGTGINHTFINDGDAECVLLVGGDAAIPGSKIFYPLNPERRPDREARGDWWHDPPQAELGPHAGLPRPRPR